MLPIVLLAASALAAPAGEAPACAALAEADFRALVLDAQAAIDRDDAALHEAIVIEVLDRAPCMTFAPPPRLWADYLISLAIVEFGRGGNWEAPLAGALRVRPGVDRFVGPGHPIAEWQAPPAEEGQPTAVPAGAKVYVDGTAEPIAIPSSPGLRLVQRELDGRWSSAVFSGPVPAEWLTAPIRGRAVVERWAVASVRVGGAGWWQTTGWETLYIPDRAWAASLQGLDLRVGLSYGAFGGELEATGSLRDLDDRASSIRLGPTAFGARATALWRRGDLAWGTGAGVAAIGTYQGLGEGDYRDVLAPYAYAVVQRRAGEGVRWDQSVLAGGSRSLLRVEVRGGRTAEGAPPVRFGALLYAQRGWLEQTEADDHYATVDTLGLAIECGVAGGGW